MNNQEVFNKAAIHMLTQKKKSMFIDSDCTDDCAYRGVDGLTCPIGHLMLDEDYSPEMEGLTLPGPNFVVKEAQLLIVAALEKSIGYEGKADQLSLLNDLQNVHDTYSPEDWPDKLLNVVYNHDLNGDCLEAFR